MGFPKMNGALGVKCTVAVVAALAASVSVSGTSFAAEPNTPSLSSMLSSNGATESSALDQIAATAASALAKSLIASGQGTAYVPVPGFQTSKWVCGATMNPTSMVGSAVVSQSAPWQFGVAEVPLPNSNYTVQGEMAVAIVYAMGPTTPATPTTTPPVTVPVTTPVTVPVTTPVTVPVTTPVTVPVTVPNVPVPTTPAASPSSSVVRVPAATVYTRAVRPHVVPGKPSLSAPSTGTPIGEELLAVAAAALLAIYFAKRNRYRGKHVRSRSWFTR